MGKTLSRPIQRSMVHRQAAKPAPGAISAPPSSVLAAFAPEDAADVQRVFAGCYDAPALSFGTPPSILDIGAHAGAATKFFLRRWPGCSVHAYEPHPDAARWFQENHKDKGWSVSLRTVAVVGANWPDAKAKLFDGLRAPWDRSLYQLSAQLTTGIDVEIQRASALPEADILKVATNGCEVDILDSYPYVTRLSAVMLRCSRESDRPQIIDRMRQSGLALVRTETEKAEVPFEMIFLRPDRPFSMAPTL